MQFLVLNLTVHILTTRLNVVAMRNAVPVSNTETTVTTAHRLGGNKLEESGLGESRLNFIHVTAIADFWH
jgi:glycine/serine hydroxymethyltransferase